MAANYWLKRHNAKTRSAVLYRYDFFSGIYYYFGTIPMQAKVMWNLADFPNDVRVNGVAVLQGCQVIYKQDLVPSQDLPSTNTLTVDFSKVKLV